MAREEAEFAFSSVEVADDRDTLGVINALERTCELEAKLRSAIQQTHPLTTTLDWDFTAADREREALLAISEQLEYLEDKLREARFLGRSDGEQRAVLLSQLDGVRRELLEVVEMHVPRIMFAKDVVREVLAFANIGDDTPRMAAQSGDARFGLVGGRSALTSPSGGQSTLLGMVNSPSQGLRASRSSAGSPGSALPPSQRYSSPRRGASRAATSCAHPHENDLWEPEKSSTPTASTVDMSSYEVARRKQPAADHSAAVTAHSQGTARDLSDGMSLPGGGRSRRYGAAAYAPKVKISDEDIYGPQPPARGARDAAPTDSPRRFGGVLKIKDMLHRAEQGLSRVAEAQEQRRVPAPPRIFSDGASERGVGGEEWEGRATPGVVSTVPSVRGEEADEVGSLWGGPALTERSERTTLSIRDWQIRAEPSQRSGFIAVTPLTSDHGTPRGGGGGFPGLVGKLAGLAFVLGSVAAATMAATAKFSGGGGAGLAQKRGGKSGRSVSKTNSAKGADQPPWAAAEAAVAARRKAASAAASSSSSRARQHQRGGNSGRDGAVQGPVMHVHQPPASRSFPANPPPDVAVAMG